MKYLKPLTTYRVARFALIGALNTAINFTVLNVVFGALHQDKFTATLAATSCAIAVSFTLNGRFVFLDKKRTAKKLMRFIVVSVAGVFIIQTSVYALCLSLLHGHETGIIATLQDVTGYPLSSDFVGVNLANFAASLAVMFWNYNGYKLVVFNGRRQSNEEVVESLGTETA